MSREGSHCALGGDGQGMGLSQFLGRDARKVSY